MLFYLHGFRSSPRSLKARKLLARMSALGRVHDYECPQLPVSPAEAAQLIHHRAMQFAPNELTLVGSSLGGYYATWLAELVGCRCVLLNPAIRPDRDLEPYLGTQTVYGSDETIVVKPEFLGELRDLAVRAITRPERYLLVAATGDEMIDWREMVARYPGAAHCIIEGSDHGLSDFDTIIDDVLAFAGVTEAPPLAPRLVPLVFQKKRAAFRMNEEPLPPSSSADAALRFPHPPPSPADAGEGARPLPPSAQKVSDALRFAGIAAEVRVLADSARTAHEAARALGIVVGQIAKSLVFRGATSGKGVLVITAGDNRVDEAKLAALLGERIARADAVFVREATGYAIGGIPPLAHATRMCVFVDETLARHAIVWAAAGTPHTVFPIAPGELVRVSGGRVADVKQD